MNGTMNERLNLMIAAGHPIFIIGDVVSLPIEAEDFFTEEEMDELREYIRSNTNYILK